MTFWRNFLPATRFTSLLVLALTLLCSVQNLQRASADDTATRDRRHRQLLTKRQVIIDDLMKDLQSVESWCVEHSVQDALPEIREVMAQLSSPAGDFDPPRMAAPEVDKLLPLDEQQWRSQIAYHRKTRGVELYTLARSALNRKFPSLAFSLVSDVVRIDPDHKYARSVLGQQFFSDPTLKETPGYAGEWVSPFEKQMRSDKKPQTYHPQYGWVPTANIPRYDMGLRPWKGGWISADKESELRRDFRNAWEIRSEHFLVRTNVSMEAGVELSQKLEIFYAWLQQNFAAFFDTPLALQERFEKATARSGRDDKPMEMHFYARREEYQKRVEGKVPADLETTGYYSSDTRTSYFFLDRQERVLPTMFHEATHQILDHHTIKDRNLAARLRAQKLKQRPTEWTLCEDSNFWILEGLACYFESFEIVEGKVVVGRPDHVRFDRAWQRLTNPADYFYMPAREFFSLGRKSFMASPQVAPLYTQASGFTHFLMHYDDGLYRDALISLLAAVYRPDPGDLRAQPSLARIAGVSFDELDHQYLIHMQNLSDQMAAESARSPATGSGAPITPDFKSPSSLRP